MASHHDVTITGHEGCYALISASPLTDTAVVFVHGFWGDAHSTWHQIQVLIDNEALPHNWCGNADLFFFEYRGASENVGKNADSLRQFLSQVFPTPSQSFFVEDIRELDWTLSFGLAYVRIREGPYHYSKLILVGHSLGGLVIRKLILDELKRLRDEVQSPNWLREWSRRPILGAKLRLFSPAHLGFQPKGVPGVAFGLKNIGAAMRVALTWWRAFSELSPGAEIIRDVRSQTENYAKACPAIPALAASVYWADREDIVVIGDYECDHAPAYGHNQTNHISVCKPTLTYLNPLAFIGEPPRGGQ
jgi:pimeloyl-ACP methyl ester carboxylesterase